MANKTHLENTFHEVQRKIGRNMLMFQHMEHLLKHIIPRSDISANWNEFLDTTQKRRESVRKQTLGQLVDQFLEIISSEDESDSNKINNSEKGWFSIKIRTEFEGDGLVNHKEKLDLIIKERNELVHHLLPVLNPDSLGSCMEIDNKLDQQRDTLIPIIEWLKGYRQLLQQAAKYLASEEGKKLFLGKLHNGEDQIINLLIDIAKKASREDGWVPLSTAGQHLKRYSPEGIASSNPNGHKSLKNLILATELFDFSEEPTVKGGVRLLYRLKPN